VNPFARIDDRTVAIQARTCPLAKAEIQRRLQWEKNFLAVGEPIKSSTCPPWINKPKLDTSKASTIHLHRRAKKRALFIASKSINKAERNAAQFKLGLPLT